MLQPFRIFTVFASLSFLFLSTGCTGAGSARPAELLPMRGADISFLDQLESLDTVFSENCTPTPLLDILRNNGVNWIRLRLWVDPSAHENWCSLSKTVAMAARVKNEGFSLLLDIHYSDWWADPSHQAIPAAWQNLSQADLVAKVEDYSRESVQAFVDAGTSPDIVQVGNEITGGMLWPLGRTGLSRLFSNPILYGSWDPDWKTGIPMVLIGDNTWQAAVPAGDVQFKVVENGTWWGDGDSDLTLDTAGGASSNLALSSAAADRILLVNDSTKAYSYAASAQADPWDNLSAYLAAGISGVKAAAPSSKIMLHLDCGDDNTACRSWFDKAEFYGLQYDVIGLSYYSVWRGKDLSALSANLNDLASRYSRDVCIVETSYPWTLGWNDGSANVYGESSQLISGYPATPAGQKAYLARIVEIVGSVPDGRGAGVFWWEPDFVAVSGFESSQENLTWFDFSLSFNGTSRAFLGEK